VFEDALLESSGRIRTRSGWFSGIAAVLNGGILCLLLLLPLLHPASLPKRALDTLLAAPAPPTLLPHVPHTVAMAQPTTPVNPFAAPVRIPTSIADRQDIPAAITDGFSNPLAQQGEGLPAGIENSLGTALPPQVHAVPMKKLAISSGVMAGNKISGGVPQYPAIARMARVQGTVVLAATISKSGTIENLRVIGGPAMLVAAAMEAVRTWRYRPYLLNGSPGDHDQRCFQAGLVRIIGWPRRRCDPIRAEC
jgi:periplasmic protein TonB